MKKTPNKINIQTAYVLTCSMTSNLFNVATKKPDKNYFGRFISAAQLEEDKEKYQKNFRQDMDRSCYISVPHISTEDRQSYLAAVYNYLDNLPIDPLLITTLYAYCNQHNFINPIVEGFSFCLNRAGIGVNSPDMGVYIHYSAENPKEIELVISGFAYNTYHTKETTGEPLFVDGELHQFTQQNKHLPYTIQVRYQIRVVNNGIQIDCLQCDLWQSTTLPTLIQDKINTTGEKVKSLVPHLEQIDIYLNRMKQVPGPVFLDPTVFPDVFWSILLERLLESELTTTELKNATDKAGRFLPDLYFTTKSIHYIDFSFPLFQEKQSAIFRSNKYLEAFTVRLTNHEEKEAAVELDFSNCPRLQLARSKIDAVGKVATLVYLHNLAQLQFEELLAFLIINPVVTSVSLKSLPANTPKSASNVLDKLTKNTVLALSREQLYHIINFMISEIQREACLALIARMDRGQYQYLINELSKQRRLALINEVIRFGDLPVGQLTYLNLTGTNINDHQIEGLAATPHLKQLILAKNPFIELPNLGALDSLVLLDLHDCTNLRGVELRAPGLAVVNFNKCSYLEIEWLAAMLGLVKSVDGIELALQECINLAGHVHVMGQCYDFSAQDIEASPKLILEVAVELAVDKLLINANPLRQTVPRPLFPNEHQLQKELNDYFSQMHKNKVDIMSYLNSLFAMDSHDELLEKLKHMLNTFLYSQNISRASGLFLKLFASSDETSRLAFYQYTVSFMLTYPWPEDGHSALKYRKLAIDFLRLFFSRNPDLGSKKTQAMVSPILRSILLQILFSSKSDERYAFFRNMLDPAYVIDDLRVYLQGNARLVLTCVQNLLKHWADSEFLEYMNIVTLHLTDSHLANLVLFYLLGREDNPQSKAIMELEVRFLISCVKRMKEPGLLVVQAMSLLLKETNNSTMVKIVHTALDLIHERIEHKHWHLVKWQSLKVAIQLFGERTVSIYGTQSTIAKRKLTNLEQGSRNNFNYALTFTQRIDILNSIFATVIGTDSSFKLLYPLEAPIVKRILQVDQLAVDDFFQLISESQKLRNKLSKAGAHLNDLVIEINKIAQIDENGNQNDDDDGPFLKKKYKSIDSILIQIDKELSPLMSIDGVKSLLRSFIVTSGLRALLRYLVEQRTNILPNDFFDILTILRSYSDFVELGAHPKNRALKMFSKHTTTEEINTFSVISELGLVVRNFVVDYAQQIKGIDIEDDVLQLFSTTNTEQRGLELLLRRLGDKVTIDRHIMQPKGPSQNN